MEVKFVNDYISINDVNNSFAILIQIMFDTGLALFMPTVQRQHLLFWFSLILKTTMQIQKRCKVHIWLLNIVYLYLGTMVTITRENF